MNVEQLIHHTKAHYLRDESVVPLWERPELLAYLNEAQSLFARHTHCLVDEVVVETVVGEDRYALDPGTVFVMEAYIEGRLLRPVSRTKLPRSIHQGKPRAYTLDAAMRTMRFGPTPDDVYDVDILYAHMPYDALVEDEDEPEIPEEYHLALCDWVAHKALRNNDTEASNTTASENFRASWGESLVQAKRELYHVRTGLPARALHNWTGK